MEMSRFHSRTLGGLMDDGKNLKISSLPQDIKQQIRAKFRQLQ
jgi:hypothetical protein